ncbi:MAG: M20/M25/M40 family metallo-hydrolase [Chitinophagaceae bacterium]|nr:MAG: M20/M25/M40 family metallo-hydrolase [Chitinophagaceae bacterium]
MKRSNELILVISLILLSAQITLGQTTFGQTTFAQTETIDTAMFRRIREAGLASSRIPMLAHYLTDVSGPRLPGSSGYRRAANWAVQTLKQWGISEAYTEAWGEFGKQWDLAEFSVALKLPYYQPLIAYPEPWSGNTKGRQQAAVILITSKQLMDTVYLKEHLSLLKGKILLVYNNSNKMAAGYATTPGRLTDSVLEHIEGQHIVSRNEMETIISRDSILVAIDKMLKKAGVVARISAPGNNVNGVVHVQSANGYKLSDPEMITKISMSFEDGQRLARLVRSGQRVELIINQKASVSTRDTKGYNVIGEIPGTDPVLGKEIVMLGGHLDSWASSTGATDNAAGCIVVMEVMRILDSLNVKPKRTIRMALWDGEEQGLYGSYNYVKKHFMNADGKPNEANQKVSGYFNLDYGTGKIRGVYAQENKEMIPVFKNWLEPFHDLDAKTVSANSTGSTDHESFDWAGIPGFQFIQDPVDEVWTHHTNIDDYDHLQIEDLKQAAVIVASFVYQAAMRDEMLPRKEFVKKVFVFDGL